jgi:SAM-dependent methyltransferase
VNSAFTSRQDIVNQVAYSQQTVVDRYAGAELCLFKSEKVILARLAHEFLGRHILDLGVGGGRTTPHLLDLSQDYLGVGYLPEMIAACQPKFPEVRFQRGDARALDTLGTAIFDIVIFSFNGIDYVNHTDRRQILGQVSQALRLGGLFWFSAHNLRVRPPKPWNPSAYEWSKNPKTILRNIYNTMLGTRNYFARSASQVEGAGYAILVDGALRFQLLTYYVDPLERVRQLTVQGFEDIRVLDHWGEERSSDDSEFNRWAHVHYLARKPPAHIARETERS